MTITLCNICTISVQQKYETRPPLPPDIKWYGRQRSVQDAKTELDSLLQYSSITCPAHVKIVCTYKNGCNFNPLNPKLNPHLPSAGIIKSSPYSPR
jgi:hypothetical protein